MNPPSLPIIEHRSFCSATPRKRYVEAARRLQVSVFPVFSPTMNPPREPTRCATAAGPSHRWSWSRIGALAVLLAVCLFASGLFAELALWRAQVCLAERNHAGALTWLNSAAWSRPHSAELHYLLAKTNRRLERFSEVQRHLQRATELGWNGADLEREIWLAQAQTGQFAAVREHWDELFLDAQSDGPEISRAFVLAALKQFRVADAMRVIASLKTDFPQEAEPYFQEARIAGVALRWQDAEQAFRAALQRASKREDIRAGLVEACLKQLKFAEAELELRPLLKRDPHNVAAQVQRAECLVRLGTLDEARELLQAILARSPDHCPALVLLGQLESGASRPREAVEALGRAVALHSEDAEIRYQYARALRAAGRDAEAAEHFRFREEGREPLLRLSKATTELVVAPRNLALRYEVGELTWRWKSHDEGAVWLLTLLELNPSHQPTHALLAEHYELLGNHDKAARHRQSAGLAERRE